MDDGTGRGQGRTRRKERKMRRKERRMERWDWEKAEEGKKRDVVEGCKMGKHERMKGFTRD